VSALAPLLWDNHTYLPQLPGTAAIEQLDRHRRAGFNVVFLNLGDADRDFESVLRMAAFARSWLKTRSDRFILLNGVEEIERARRERKLAVGFNLEGLFSLGEQIAGVSLFYDLGVRWALFAYNRRNLLGSGVHDETDLGLTGLGRRVVAEMDRVGMIKCLSHTGHKTVQDILNCSEKPCIFSHSNADVLWHHARNIPDRLIRACAAQGGVVGINGIGIFLGSRSGDPALMADHIDYVAQLVGVEHVGIGMDYGYTVPGEIDPSSDPAYWPAGHGYDSDRGSIPTVAPEQIGEVLEHLVRKGYSDSDLALIKGENMLRVACAVWQPVAA
jgi:membrane dipeptidase